MKNQLIIPINIQRFASGEIVGANSGSLRGKIYYEYSQNTAANTTYITFYVQASKTSNTTSASSGSKVPVSIVTENINYTATRNIYPNEFKIDKNHWETIYSVSTSYQHSGNGKKSINVTGYVKGPTASSLSGNQVNISGSITFPDIPRYATINRFVVNQESETSVRIEWGADSECDAVQYSINNGNWVGASGTSFSVGGLSANTPYNFKIQVRRKDSQLWTPSGNVSQTTYQYPYIQSISYQNLAIGQEQSIILYNPLHRNVTVYMKKDSTSGTLLYSGTTTSHNAAFKFTPNTDTLYSSVLNNEVGTAEYYCVYNNKIVRTIAGTYTCIAAKLKTNSWGRPNSTGTTITKTKLNGSFYAGKLNGVQNTLTIKYNYQQEGGTKSNDIVICNAISASNNDVTISNNTFEVKKAITISGMDYKKTCTIKVMISDKKTSNTYTIVVPRGTPVWWWTKDYFGVSKKIILNGVPIEVIDE